ncbi:MAG: host attachment protein, partial [Acidimicrobiales bacterium]|nr:host attachment protein [Acidimicrobiales bacterium]
MRDDDPQTSRGTVLVITEDAIRSLAAIRSDHSVTSCYLDVDGRRHVREADYERVFDSMVRRARADGAPQPDDADLERIDALVRGGFDRARVRGLAVFSSVADDLWEVVELPVSVRSQLVVNASPAVGQLEGVVQQSITIGVLAVDKAHARVFVFNLDELIEHREVTDDLGRDYDTVGEHDRGGVDDHREELEHQHLRHAASLLWSAYQAHGFDHLAVAAPDHLAGEVEAGLHPYLRERLRGPLPVEPSATESQIRDAVLEMEAAIERERENASVARLREAVSAGKLGVAGLDDV